VGKRLCGIVGSPYPSPRCVITSIRAHRGGESLTMKGIDYRRIRATIDTADVLKLIGFTPKRRLGDELRGLCPLCRQTRGRGTFAVNTRKGVGQCFGCGQKGNTLELYVKASGKRLYEASIDLCRRLIGRGRCKSDLGAFESR
jgi:hypothetical protein